jgi:acylphosphatase
MNDEFTAIRARITGRVQGVWFRGWTQKEARKRGLKGWVRNEADGSVTALLYGPRSAVDDMLRALWQGPPAAKVSDVETYPDETGDIHAGFEVVG